MSRCPQSARQVRQHNLLARAAALTARVAAGITSTCLAGTAGAADAAADGASSVHPPWLFVTVAFIACALAFFACGVLLARQRGRQPPDERRAAKQIVSSGTPAAAAASGASPGTVAGSVAGAIHFDALEVLEALAGVAFVAERQRRGLVVVALNAPAQALWPHAGVGSSLESLAGLSAASRGALDSLRAAQATTFDGWRLAMLSGTAGAPPRYLLMQGSGAAAEGDIFGSTLSHDLRAPIRVVEGFTRIMKEDYGMHLDRVGNEHLDRVLGAAARMNLMIDALLTMARLSAQPLARQPVDLSQIAHHVVDDLRRGSAARAVEVEIEPDLGASGDPTLLRLVLENLLGNAWKYTARTEAAHIALRRATFGGERAFQVSDNGAGFDMRSADRLFGLFQRLHSANDFPGHGVGLASARRIVRRHGGDIWAESRPGQGATFTFTLG